MAKRLPKVIYVRWDDDEPDGMPILVAEESADDHAVVGKSVSVGVYALQKEGDVVQNIHFVPKSGKRGA